MEPGTKMSRSNSCEVTGVLLRFVAPSMLSRPFRFFEPCDGG